MAVNHPRVSFIDDRLGYNDEEVHENEHKTSDKERWDKEHPMWDTFKAYSSATKKGSMQESKCLDSSVKLIKILIYLLCFFVTLVGSVSAACAVLFLLAQTRERQQQTYCSNQLAPVGTFTISPTTSSTVIYAWSFLLLLVVPDFLSLISALWMSLFRRNPVYPRRTTLAIVFAFETVSCVGTGMLLFGGLGAVNTPEAAGLIASVGSVPALFNLFSRRLAPKKIHVFLFTTLCDTLALAAQLSGIVYSVLLQTSTNTSFNWFLPVGLLLSTFRYWGNYTSRRSRIGILRYLARQHVDFQSKKHLFKAHFALYRMLLYFLLCLCITVFYRGVESGAFFTHLLNSKHQVLIDTFSDASSYVLPFRRYGQFFETTPEGDAILVSIDNSVPITASLVAVGCGFLVYQMAKFSYKTHMNGFGFALPIILVGPCTLTTVVLLLVSREDDACALRDWFPDFLFFDKGPSSLKDATYYTHYRLYLWLVWFLSHAWLTRHIFFSNCPKLAKKEEIFDCVNWDNNFINIFLPLNVLRKESNDEPIDNNADVDPDLPIPDIYEVTINPVTIVPPPIPSPIPASSNSNTKIYACATMWHEEKSEMKELIGSILRMDRDQCAMRVTQTYYGVKIHDYYELETHIFFDDAFKCLHDCLTECPHPDTESQVNQYVLDLLETIETTVQSHNMRYTKPVKYPTPFGGRLVWQLPGGSQLMVHLKDKNRIRHRKRWSQVMYMYYLLGYRLMSSPISSVEKEEMAENTYILTLDGDIDFQPGAVKILVDLMQKNRELGAACGRIHPVGKGPMIWFQKFEYAIGHWLQKSTEHTIGSVLCSPGCFSLFRAKSLMRNNVMAKYASKSTEPRHYIQYDQGEDRWLCTLILQAGCRVEYSAASDAYTHAPEKFRDFFIQRRRWIPSTVANILDLLNTARDTRKLNSDISWVYIAYQWILMGSTVLGPGTIFLMMVGAAATAFKISNWISFTYNLLPLLLFILVCLLFREPIQLLVAEIISIIYSLVMVVVFVGIMLQIAEDGMLSPTTLLFFVIALQFVLTGLLHPREWTCLFCGLIYYILVPSMYMILIVYSIFNVNNVSWGTREKKSRALERAEELQEQRENDELDRVEGKHKGRMQFTLATLFSCSLCLHRSKTDSEKKLEEIQETLENIAVRLEEIERANKLAEHKESPEHVEDEECGEEECEEEEMEEEKLEGNSMEREPEETIKGIRQEIDLEINQSDYLVSPCWLKDQRMKRGEIDFLSNDEEEFWTRLIDKYLYPIDNDGNKQKEISEQLLTLRNEYVTKFFLLNALFVLIVFLMQLNKDTLHLQWPLGITFNITFDPTENRVIMKKEYLKLEPIGCLFIAGFVSILVIQFLAMLVHRMDTFFHILANTSLGLPCTKKPETELSFERHAEGVAMDLQRMLEDETMVGGSNYNPNSVCYSNGNRFSCNTDYVDKGGFESVFRRKLNEPTKGISRLFPARFQKKKEKPKTPEGSPSMFEYYNEGFHM